MNPSFSHIQMVAIDCDETLLRSDNTVSEYTKGVLHRLQDKGIRITIATGRMYQTAKPVGMSLQLGNVPMILFSGGLIQELESGRKLFERTVPLDTVQQIWKIASQYGWHIQSYVDDTATLVRSQQDFLEIIAPHVSKGDALEQLAQQYGIGLEHIISFGNAENDISMLSKTGYSVAVENAVDHVKLVACEVCGHHNEDGVAHWIEEHLL